MRGRPTSAEESGIRLLMIFAWNLRHYEEGDVADARFPIHTGRLEGMRYKMKDIKRQAYGFCDDDYFILKIKTSSPGICTRIDEEAERRGPPGKTPCSQRWNRREWAEWRERAKGGRSCGFPAS